MRDFSIEKSYESFCTDSSMRSDYDQKAAEARKFDRETKASNFAKQQTNSMMNLLNKKFKNEAEVVVVDMAKDKEMELRAQDLMRKL